MKKKEAKNENSIDTMFDRNFHFVSRTEGETLRTVRTHTSLFGGWGPCRCLEGSGAFRRRHSKRANKTTPTRHLSVLAQSLQHWFHLGTPSFFSNVFGGASSSCDRNVQQTTSGRFYDQRRARSKFGKKVPGSCNRFQAWSCGSLRHRTGRRTRTPVREAVFDMAAGNTWHCQRERVINDVVLTWTRVWASAAAALARMSSLNDSIFFFFLNFAKNFHLNSWSMPFLLRTVQERKTKPERETGTWKTKIDDGEFLELI